MYGTIGINLWNWVPVFTDADLPLIDRAASLGFGVVEIGMNSLEFDHAAAGRRAKAAGVALDLCGAFTTGRDLSNFDPEVRAATKKYFVACLDAAAEMGARLFAGPVYAGGGKAHALPPDEKRREWDLAVEGLREMAREAAKRGVTIGLEPIQRYRTSVVNTVSQALEMIDDVGSPVLGIHFDTFQANIEERSVEGALAQACASGRLVHFHASENHRGPPGSGHIEWEALFSLLAQARYGGHITMETFPTGGFDAAWTAPVADPDGVARAGLSRLSGLAERFRLASPKKISGGINVDF